MAQRNMTVSGKLSAWFSILSVLVCGIVAGSAVTLALTKKKCLQESACEKRFSLLFQGRCAEAKCAVTWDEMGVGTSESNKGRRSSMLSSLWTPGPISCPMKNEVPWVKCTDEGSVDFACALPDGGSQ